MHPITSGQICGSKLRMRRVFTLGVRSRPGKPNQKKVSSWTFRRGIPEQKFNVNRACFPKGKHQNSQKRAKFMNFSFWPFLWFGLLGRLLKVTDAGCPRIQDSLRRTRAGQDMDSFRHTHKPPRAQLLASLWAISGVEGSHLRWPDSRESIRIRTIVKPLWQLPPSEAKNPPKFPEQRMWPLNYPKYPLLRDILGNLRATFLQSWVIFAFFCVLGVVGHRGFTIVLRFADSRESHANRSRVPKLDPFFANRASGGLKICES